MAVAVVWREAIIRANEVHMAILLMEVLAEIPAHSAMVMRAEGELQLIQVQAEVPITAAGVEVVMAVGV